MSTEAENVATRLKNLGLLRTQGLIAGKWVDAHDKKTIKVSQNSQSLLFLFGSDMDPQQINQDPCILFCHSITVQNRTLCHIFN
jgi:hypothetical protein